jgi:hypothetical protein
VSRRTVFHLAAAFSVAAAAVGLAVAVVGAKPAQALPAYASTCSSCHTAAPSGTVTATPSKTSLSPNEAYTVQVAVGLTASGQAGYWISSNDAATPAVSLTGGPGTAPFTASMTAPATAGTYTYKISAAKGKPSSGGMAQTTTFQITVGSASPPSPPATPPAGPTTGDTQAPVTTAAGPVNGGWCASGAVVKLSAADNPGGAGIAYITYTLDGGAPVKITGASAQVPISGDGQHTIRYAATDLSGNVETARALTLNVDGSAPTAAVLANAKVKRGAKATIKCRVSDTPGNGAAVTTVKIRNKAGKVVKTLKSGAQPVGSAHSLKFTCKLPAGVYRVSATAADKVGNVSAVSAGKKLTVR